MAFLRTSWLLLGVLLALEVVPSPAAAQRRDADRRRAVELFEQSAAAYRDGRFTEAVALLEEAYRLSPEPVLLYNLARAQEGLGNFPEAIDAYTRYLEAEPRARDRGAIEQRVATLRREVAERERLERERAELERRGSRRGRDEAGGPVRTTPTEETDPGADGPGIAPWLTMGIGVAILAGGAVVAGLAVSTRNEAEDEPVHERTVELVDDAEGLATAANVLFIAGGIVAGAGILWLVLAGGGADDETDPAVALRIGPGGVSVEGTL